MPGEFGQNQGGESIRKAQNKLQSTLDGTNFLPKYRTYYSDGIRSSDRRPLTTLSKDVRVNCNRFARDDRSVQVGVSSRQIHASYAERAMRTRAAFEARLHLVIPTNNQ